MKYWWVWYRLNNVMKQTCVGARNPEMARKVAEAWQRKEESNGNMVALVPRPDQARIEPFCVADEELLKTVNQEANEGRVVTLDYSTMNAAKVIDGLTQGFLDPGVVYSMEIDGDRRKGVLSHLRDKFSQPPQATAARQDAVV